MKKPIIRPHFSFTWVCIFIIFPLTAQPQVLPEKTANQVTLREMLDLVNADSIAKTIQDLQNFNTRYEYTSGRREAAQYLHGRFRHYSQEVSYDAFQFSAPLFSLGVPYYLIHADFFRLAGTSTLWIAGDNGLILKSEDNGETWYYLQIGVPDFLTRIFFIDPLRGWCTGKWGNVYRTTDGGNNWTVIPIGSRDSLDGIVFADSLRGWVIQNNPTTNRGKILATQDGGLSWAPQLEPTYQCTFYDLTFTTPDSGFAVGWSWNSQNYQCVVASTSNAGLSWDIKGLSPGGLLDMDFVDSKHGWAAGYAEPAYFISRTQDGGKTWIKIYSSSTDKTNMGVDFTDQNHGWSVELTGGILQTSDGGESWQLRKQTYDFMYSVASMDSNSCMALSMNQIHQTTDGGVTWKSFSPDALQSSSENVAAVVRGTVQPDSVVIIGAHYDCSSDDPYRYAPGANDNASGVAGVMELARIFGLCGSPYTLEFVAFSAEEHDGLFGSRHYAEESLSSGKKVKAMINLDIIGGTAYKKWYVVLKTDPAFSELADLASGMAVAYTKAIPYPKIYDMGMDAGSDHYSFFKQGYPTLGVAARYPEGTYPPNYHTTKDELSKLTMPYEAEIVKAVLATVAALSGMDVTVGIEERPAACVPDQPVLYANFPNPFNPGTIIRYSIPKPSGVVLKIFSILGREIATLADGSETAGEKSVIWDGKDQGGNPVSSGIYICKLLAGGETLTRRIAVMR